MAVRIGSAQWNGSLKDGNGNVSSETGVLKNTPFSFSSRFEEESGTNPEELIGAAHAGCFSMALSAGLGEAGYTPNSIQTTDKVHLTKGDAGFAISKIEITTEADIPNIDEETFLNHAESAKNTCPVSKALAGVEFELTASLK
ncbi:MAG: Peroxiredoxin OsmC [Candidatus Marinimicrobia bacterium]|nr:Peroxiredoxin OsmC [Candidatus Neomarinimicrobiota bacterium]